MVLEGEGIAVRDAASAEEALPWIVEREVSLVLCDLRLGGMSGLELLQKSGGQVPFVMISGHASVADAVEAIRLGAVDFFEKPLDRDRVLLCVKNALARVSMAQELALLRAQLGPREEMLGASAPMRALHAAIEKVAPTKGRVLILGESGTGKELVARAIHRLSPRSAKPFIKVNCAAIPAELVESELFGHEKGAFTGAVGRKRGFFEAAHGGTLLLDEVGDMPLSAQAKVLRALQQGEITRVGSEHTLTVDVRVLAATHRDLAQEVSRGSFREDLFFRLNVVPLRVPPLRERGDDVALLALSFVAQLCEEHGMRSKVLEPAVLRALCQRTWPGNVRELRNLVERMVILSDECISLDDLPDEMQSDRVVRASALQVESPRALHESMDVPSAEVGDGVYVRRSLRDVRDDAEREYILQTLRSVEWNISRAAALLDIERTHLHKKLKAFDLRRDETERN